MSEITLILDEVPIFKERVTTPYDEYVEAGHTLYDFFHTTMTPQYNELRGQYNTLSEAVNGYATNAKRSQDAASTHATNALSNKNETLAYRNETESFRNEVFGYVVPTNATYTPEQIDAKDENIRLESFLDFTF